MNNQEMKVEVRYLQQGDVLALSNDGEKVTGVTVAAAKLPTNKCWVSLINNAGKTRFVEWGKHTKISIVRAVAE